ncbi:heterokaryon incompatibility protein-domain-containing protein, partial [Bisporella sp. PMI_857]
MRFKFYTSGDDISSHFISQRPVNRDTGGRAALAAARLSLETCMNDHISCQTPNKPLLPTRALDVGDPLIRLYSSKIAQRAEYAALSYCWGGTQTTQTTSSTIDAFSKGLDLRICSQTIQDAVVVTRGLGLQYLWIDALCIIQGQTSDKMHEIASMGKIYKNATVTISAANSSSAQAGFLKHQGRGASVQTALLCTGPNQELSLKRSDSSISGRYGKVWLELERVHNHSTEPLSQRGWAFQEQVLSLRLLQYGSEGVTWHCLDADKTVPVLRSFVRYKPRSKASRPAILRRTKHNRRGLGYQLWSEMIEDYSSRHLTISEDRLLAIAGIASELHDLSQDTYLGGLWQEDLVRQLGWKQIEGDERAARPLSRAPNAPSWSWASVDGGI